jgi:hypothetical protein
MVLRTALPLALLTLTAGTVVLGQTVSPPQSSTTCMYTTVTGSSYDLTKIGKPPAEIECTENCNNQAKAKLLIASLCEPLSTSQLTDANCVDKEGVLGYVKPKDSKTCNVYGKINEGAAFSAGKDYLRAVYTGDKCTSSPDQWNTLSYLFHCDKDASTEKFILEASACSYDLHITSKYACPAPPPPAIPGSVVFLLVLMGAFAVYCCAGCFYNRQFKGASGLESVPNVDFWRSFVQNVEEGLSWTWLKLTCQKQERTLMHQSLMQEEEGVLGTDSVGTDEPTVTHL